MYLTSFQTDFEEISCDTFPVAVPLLQCGGWALRKSAINNNVDSKCNKMNSFIKCGAYLM